MENYKYNKKSIIVFFTVVIALSGIVEFLICKNQTPWAYTALMWIPAVAACLASYISFKDTHIVFTPKQHFARMGISRCSQKYVLAGVVIPFVYLLVPYMIYWRMYPENYAYNGVSLGLVLEDCLLPGIIGIFFSLLTALGEEIGWRGFLVPALYERLGLNKTLLVTGLFWCIWHFPLLIWGGYIEGLPLLYSLLAFVLCIFPIGVICGILALKSGSMWPCAFLHAAHNNFDQSIFDVLTKGADKAYYVGETGIYTIACTWIIAVLMYAAFREKQKSENQ